MASYGDFKNKADITPSTTTDETSPVATDFDTHHRQSLSTASITSISSRQFSITSASLDLCNKHHLSGPVQPVVSISDTFVQGIEDLPHAPGGEGDEESLAVLTLRKMKSPLAPVPSPLKGKGKGKTMEGKGKADSSRKRWSDGGSSGTGISIQDGKRNMIQSISERDKEGVSSSHTHWSRASTSSVSTTNTSRSHQILSTSFLGPDASSPSSLRSLVADVPQTQHILPHTPSPPSRRNVNNPRGSGGKTVNIIASSRTMDNMFGQGNDSRSPILSENAAASGVIRKGPKDKEEQHIVPGLGKLDRKEIGDTAKGEADTSMVLHATHEQPLMAQDDCSFDEQEHEVIEVEGSVPADYGSGRNVFADRDARQIVSRDFQYSTDGADGMGPSIRQSDGTVSVDRPLEGKDTRPNVLETPPMTPDRMTPDRKATLPFTHTQPTNPPKVEDFPFSGEFASKHTDVGENVSGDHTLSSLAEISIPHHISSIVNNILPTSTVTDPVMAPPLFNYVPRLLRPRYTVNFTWGNMLLPSSITIRRTEYE